jgi:hypothetical protein
MKMEPFKALEILLKVTTIWPRQPADDAHQAEWAESLGRVSFESALEAVREFRDSGHHEAPTSGEVYALAKSIDERKDSDRRRAQKKLEMPKPSAEEIARARAALSDIMQKISSRWPEK